MARIICALDVETTGLSSETDQVTEIGAILWDTELNVPVKFFSKLLCIEGSVPPEIVKLTGITDELLRLYGEDPEDAWAEFFDFCGEADAFMAHNAPFDRGFIAKKMPVMDPQLWIDSCVDVDYPESITTRKLTHLAAEHGFVNPFAHRAVTDVLTMCQVVARYPWEQTILNAKTPNVELRAMVSYNDNAKAKARGYRWSGDRKFWIKNVKEHRVEQETKECLDAGFAVRKVG